MMRGTFFLIFIFFTHLSNLVLGAIPAPERVALIAIYNSTNGDCWGHNDGWKTPPLDTDGFAMPGTEGDWFGVTVSEDHVIILFLYSDNQEGTLPAELGNLSKLEYLNLTQCKLHGRIPPEIGNLSQLKELFLNENNLSGSIPSELGNLSQLTILYLGNNQLSGSIPKELGNLPLLFRLCLNNNQLSGSIPQELGNLQTLWMLNLRENPLTGSIPKELGNLSRLGFLYLDHCQLSGSLPLELGNLPKVIEIHLNHNQLQGSLPPELSHLPQAGVILLNDNKLSSSIPPEWGNFCYLNFLDLNNNQLSGSIPPELSYLTNLIYLGLANNQLSGNIPPELSKLTQLHYVTLSFNRLSGSIPPTTGNLTSLQELLLQNNRLSGTIPPELGNIKGLNTINLQFNQLTGSIPTQLSQQDSLMYLYLNNNHLGGIIPSSLIKLSFLQKLDIGYNCLSTTDEAMKAWLYKYDRDWGSHQDQCSGITTPIVTTHALSAITATSAVSGGTVLTEGNSTVTARGVCWHTAQNPTINHSKTSAGIGTGSFSCTITSLQAHTTYYLRAYATNAIGTAYGEERTFTTSSGTGLPTVTTGLITAITSSAAMGGGLVTADNNTQVLARGLCWSRATHPTIADSKTTNGTGTGSFSGHITDLSASTIYYVRAYATHMAGTVYGLEKSFTTSRFLPEMDPPFGSFDTPLEGATVSGSIPVTGWALDDSGVERVKLYREAGNDLIYIGEAQFVEGARPDVAIAYPDYPANTRAGWGYMLLTNFLPDNGNGMVVLLVEATDIAGKSTTLGRRVIYGDNAHAVKPFGAIDAPTQGGTASGHSYTNWGWVLTPPPNRIPSSGTTLNVWIDGVSLGHPTYNLYRADIASLFPDYANSNGAVGYLEVDTTTYAAGVHTIQWTATDSGGNSDGIGSRYFTIQNADGSRAHTTTITPFTTAEIGQKNFQIHGEPLTWYSGFGSKEPLKLVLPDKHGECALFIQELERVEIHLCKNGKDINGYLVTGETFTPLPIGSTLDHATGTFFWSPGPGFVGTYRFVFTWRDNQNQWFINRIHITITPKDTCKE